MAPDIELFIERSLTDLRSAGCATKEGASQRQLIEAAAQFEQRYGLALPQAYLDICHMTNGLGVESSLLYGIRSETESHSDFVDLFSANDELQEDLSVDGFIEFGMWSGFEPWGWNVQLQKFVRSDRNRRDAMTVFDSFEEMFRALFALQGR